MLPKGYLQQTKRAYLDYLKYASVTLKMPLTPLNYCDRLIHILIQQRLIIQSLLLFWLIYSWLDIFPNSHLLLGFNHLIAAMNQFKPWYVSG